jgi:flagellar hook-basal body complex protein FliE
MQPISSSQFSALVAKNLPRVSVPAQDAESFKNVLLQGLQQVNAMQADADKAVEALFTGGDANMAEVLTAVKKADISFRLMVQMRNKLVQAYQDIQDIRI